MSHFDRINPAPAAVDEHLFRVDSAVKLIWIVFRFFLVLGLSLFIARRNILRLFVQILNNRSIISNLTQIAGMNSDNTIALFQTAHDFVAFSDGVC